MNNLGAGKGDINPGNQNQLHFRYVENWQKVETFSVTWIVLIIPVQFFFLYSKRKLRMLTKPNYLFFFFSNLFPSYVEIFCWKRLVIGNFVSSFFMFEKIKFFTSLVLVYLMSSFAPSFP